MNKYFTLRWATLLLALALPSLSWGFGYPPNPVLIVTGTGSPYQADVTSVVTFLSGRLTAAGLGTVTSVNVPSVTLAPFKQIWDIRLDTTLSGPDMAAYMTYMQGGGTLFVMGEVAGFLARNTSITALILASGGGVVTLGGVNAGEPQTVHSPFTGPVALTSLTFAGAGSFTSLGNGQFITTDTSTSGSGIIFGPGTMTNASAGVLASVLDINFMDPTGPNSAPMYVSQALTDNLIAYLAAPSVIPSGATTYTLSGPTGGTLNTASANFTVTPNASYTGTITITPSGGGLSTQIVLTFSSAAAQTFTITPTAAGPVTLTATNSGSLTNPAALTYLTPPSAPTIGTATPGGRSASVAFTAPVTTGGSPIILYTASCSPGGQTGTGTSGPVTVSGLTAGSTYTCTVTATNAQGVSAASAASNPITIPATGYTLTGPAGGLINNVSGAFTITPNAAFTGTITITVSGGGATAASVTRTRNPAQGRSAIVRTFKNSSAPLTFTVTPISVGPVTVTTTNNASLVDPPALSYATPPGAPTGVSAAPGSGSVVVAFTPPSSGGSPIISYTATCSGGSAGTGTSSPITITGLGLGSSYVCSVTATNSFGVSAASNLSSPVTPVSLTPAPATLGLVTIGAMALFLWNRRRSVPAQ